MSVSYLEQILRREREDAAVFTPLPHHYLEIASLLLNTASDDIGEETHPDLMVAGLNERHTFIFCGHWRRWEWSCHGT